MNKSTPFEQWPNKMGWNLGNDISIWRVYRGSTEVYGVVIELGWEAGYGNRLRYLHVPLDTPLFDAVDLCRTYGHTFGDCEYQNAFDAKKIPYVTSNQIPLFV